MKEWIIASWSHLLIGFAVGWLVFKRPAWAEAILSSIWNGIQGLFSPLIAKIKSKV